jgi:hypothetical protein
MDAKIQEFIKNVEFLKAVEYDVLIRIGELAESHDVYLDSVRVKIDIKPHEQPEFISLEFVGSEYHE